MSEVPVRAELRRVRLVAPRTCRVLTRAGCHWSRRFVVVWRRRRRTQKAVDDKLKAADAKLEKGLAKVTSAMSVKRGVWIGGTTHTYRRGWHTFQMNRLEVDSSAPYFKLASATNFVALKTGLYRMMCVVAERTACQCLRVVVCMHRHGTGCMHAPTLPAAFKHDLPHHWLVRRFKRARAHWQQTGWRPCRAHAWASARRVHACVHADAEAKRKPRRCTCTSPAPCCCMCMIRCMWCTRERAAPLTFNPCPTVSRYEGIGHGGWCHNHAQWFINNKPVVASAHWWNPGTWQTQHQEATFVVKAGQNMYFRTCPCLNRLAWRHVLGCYEPPTSAAPRLPSPQVFQASLSSMSSPSPAVSAPLRALGTCAAQH